MRKKTSLHRPQKQYGGAEHRTIISQMIKIEQVVEFILYLRNLLKLYIHLLLLCRGYHERSSYESQTSYILALHLSLLMDLDAKNQQTHQLHQTFAVQSTDLMTLCLVKTLKFEVNKPKTFRGTWLVCRWWKTCSSLSMLIHSNLLQAYKDERGPPSHASNLHELQ